MNRGRMRVSESCGVALRTGACSHFERWDAGMWTVRYGRLASRP